MTNLVPLEQLGYVVRHSTKGVIETFRVSSSGKKVHCWMTIARPSDRHSAKTNMGFRV